MDVVDTAGPATQLPLLARVDSLGALTGVNPLNRSRTQSTASSRRSRTHSRPLP